MPCVYVLELFICYTFDYLQNIWSRDNICMIEVEVLVEVVHGKLYNINVFSIQ